jgi:flagellar hook-associated protein 2
MAISASGIGSNLDINGIISQLMQVEAQPLTLLGRREASYQAKLSAFGTIKGLLSAFQAAVHVLKDASRYATFKATSSDSTVMSATATTKAVAGSYVLDVTTLAKAQIQAAGTRYADTTTALNLTGDLSFTVGGNSFSVDVTPTDTLQDIAAAINAAPDNKGVSASIVNDGGNPGNRLVITAEDSGLANTVTIGGSLNRSGKNAPFAFAVTQAAQDLSMTVNGISVSKSSNTVTDAIQGVTLTVLNEGAATVTVARDSATAKSAVDGFVKAYNDLNAALTSLSAYNAETKSAAVLQGESSVRTMQSQLRAVLSATISGTFTYRVLSQLGISSELNGSLKVDADKLNEALAANPADVAKFFTGNGVDGNPLGLATRLNTLTTSLLGSGGILSSATDGLTRSIRDIDTRREVLERRLVDIEARYRKQFTALDVLISNMTQTSTYLQQQLANLPTIGDK